MHSANRSSMPLVLMTTGALLSLTLLAGTPASACGGAKGPRIDRTTYEIDSPVRWRTLEKGRAEAIANGVPLLVHFSFGRQCPDCVAREERLAKNRGLRDLLNDGSRAVPVRIPLWAMTAAERALAEKAGYGEDCMLALVQPDGTVVVGPHGKPFKTHGIPSADALLDILGPLTS